MAEEERLTRQDLIYAATALRQAARISQQKAADPTFFSCRRVFEEAAEAEAALAAKFDRIARRTA